MRLLAPIWLVMLVPWCAIVVWILRGARESSRVPFLPLWSGTEAQPRTHRRMRIPPAPIALALLAALLAILAAARPAFPPSSPKTPLVLIIDRGLTMSARSLAGYRFVQTTHQLLTTLQSRFPTAEVELLPVPPAPQIPPHRLSLAEASRQVESLAPTACDTRQSLSDVIAANSAADQTLLVVTDQPIPSPRAIQISPTDTVEDVAITRLAVRDTPTTQAMLELRNQSPRTKATVRLSTGDVQLRRELDLPASPAARAYFFDLPSVSDTVRAQILGADAIPANDLAWSVREKTFPQIEPRSPLPPDVSRIIQAYSKSRPPNSAPQSTSDSNSPRILLTTDPSALPPTETGAILLPAQDPSQHPVLAVDHPITRHVDWQSLTHLQTTSTLPPEGWTPILTSGPAVLLAVKPTAPRQAWIAFDSPDWQVTTDFVVFWTNLFDYLAGSHSTTFTSHPLSTWTPDWKLDNATPGQWPGLYSRPDGRQRAFTAPDLPLAPPPASDWPSRLPQSTALPPSTTDLSPALYLSALTCLLASLTLWRR